MKKMSKGLYIALFVLFAAVFIRSAVYLVTYFMDSRASQGAFESLAALVGEDEGETEAAPETGAAPEGSGTAAEQGPRPRILQNKYRTLFEQNPDLAGWLTVEGTNINYPVMFTGPELDRVDYYIHRDYEGKYNSHGTLYIREDNDPFRPSDNVIIYGHNMKDRTMFGQLRNFEKKEFWDGHRYFDFNTIYEDHRYEIICVFKAQVETESKTDFGYYFFVDAENEAEFDEYVASLKAHQLYETGVEAHYGDKLVELSTCEYSRRNGRLVVVGKRID